MFQYDNQFVVVKRDVGPALHRPGRRGVGHRRPGGRSRPCAARSGEAIEKRLGYPYRALDWQTQNASLFSALQLEKLAMGLIIFFIMVVAAFNIVGTLTMVVADKTREIGILRAMGLTSPAVARVFLLQGAVIGVVGHGRRAGGRARVAYVVDKSGWIRINPAVYFIDHLPVHVEVRGRASWSSLASLAIAVLATIYPSRVGRGAHAGRRDPPRMSAILEAQGLRKVYRGGRRQPDRGAVGRGSRREPRRVRRHRRGERLGEEHAAPPPGRARHADRRARCGSTALAYGEQTRRRAGRDAEPEDRVRLPVPSPAAGVHRAGERHDAAADRRRAARAGPARGRRSCWPRWGWRAG